MGWGDPRPEPSAWEGRPVMSTPELVTLPPASPAGPPEDAGARPRAPTGGGNSGMPQPSGVPLPRPTVEAEAEDGRECGDHQPSPRPLPFFLRRAGHPAEAAGSVPWGRGAAGSYLGAGWPLRHKEEVGPPGPSAF